MGALVPAISKIGLLVLAPEILGQSTFYCQHPLEPVTGTVYNTVSTRATIQKSYIGPCSIFFDHLESIWHHKEVFRGRQIHRQETGKVFFFITGSVKFNSFDLVMILIFAS